MRINLVLSIILLTAVLLACARPENASQTTGNDRTVEQNGFLTLEDLAPQPNLSDLSKADLEDALLDMAWTFPLYDKEDTRHMGWYHECLGRKMREVKFSATKSVATYEIDAILNKAQCKEYEVMEEDPVSEVRYKFFISISCNNTDLSSLNGTRVKDININHFYSTQCLYSDEIKLLQNTKEKLTYIEGQGDDIASVVIEESAADMSEAGEACTWRKEQNTWATDSCISIHKTNYLGYNRLPPSVAGTEPDDAKYIYVRASFNGLKGTFDNPYFQPAEADLLVNDWKGHVTQSGISTLMWYLRRDDKEQTGALAVD